MAHNVSSKTPARHVGRGGGADVEGDEMTDYFLDIPIPPYDDEEYINDYIEHEIKHHLGGFFYNRMEEEGCRVDTVTGVKHKPTYRL